MIAFLAAALLVQETPAELLKKVEAKYAAAKTLSVTMTARRSVTGGNSFSEESWNGSFWSKGTGQVRVEIVGQPKWTYISDGTTMSFALDKKPPEKRGATAGLGEWMRRFSARAGLYGLMSSAYAAIFKSKAPKFETLYAVGELADGGEEKVGGVNCRIVKGRFFPPESKSGPMAFRLWIDPKSLVLVQRETVSKTGKETATMFESFTHPVFDDEIADDHFKVP